MPKKKMSLEEIKERAKKRRSARRLRIMRARNHARLSAIAEKDLIMDWFDRLPLDLLRTIHAGCQRKFGERPWKPTRRGLCNRKDPEES